jgi:hypothetical protein
VVVSEVDAPEPEEAKSLLSDDPGPAAVSGVAPASAVAGLSGIAFVSDAPGKASFDDSADATSCSLGVFTDPASWVVGVPAEATSSSVGLSFGTSLADAGSADSALA